MKSAFATLVSLIISLLSAAGQSIYEYPDTLLDNTSVSYALPAIGQSSTVTASARAAVAKSSSWWSVELSDSTDTIAVTFTPAPVSYHDSFDRRLPTVTARHNSASLHSASVSEGIATEAKEYNTLSVMLRGDSLSVWTGHKQLRYLFSSKMSRHFTPTQITVSSVGKARLSQVSAKVEPAISDVAATRWNVDSLNHYLTTASLSSPEGIWDYLDRNTTPRKAREGGRYSLAVVKSMDYPGAYDIIYLSGARVNSSQWKPGMRKGLLLPTDYVDHYDLHWIDATFQKRTADIYATIEQSSILTLHFPLLESSLRFTRR